MTEKFQALPRDGYTAMFRRMLTHPKIEVRLNADFREVRQQVHFRHLIYTGPMSEMRRLARHGTITVEIEGNTTGFEQQIPLLDEIGSVTWERVGSEYRISFLGEEQLPVYIHRVLDLVDRTGVDLLHFNTGEDEIEEAFLRRLEEDRTRGFLRASAWAATQRLAGHDKYLLGEAADATSSETVHAGISGPPSV